MSTHLTNDSPVETPVRLDDLYQYFQAGSKSPDQWRIGVEFEKKIVRRANGQPVGFDEADGIEAILSALVEQFGWQPHFENSRLTTLTRNGSTISLEPGGQLEFATSPVQHLGQVNHELNEHMNELQTVVDLRRIAFLSCGVSPLANIDDVTLNPRSRHRLMADVLPTLSTYGLHMMKCTCSTQVCLDYADTADAMRKFRVALLLSPVINAAFNNAPWYGNRPTGYHSYRAQIWQHMDPSRSGWLVPLLKEGLTLVRWIDYVLNVPLLLYSAGSELKQAPALTFREYMQAGIDGHYPTLDDWQLHLSTIFTEVRMKQFLEVRGADAVPRPYVLGVPALWKGILYDAESLQAAEELVRPWPVSELAELADVVSHQSLDAPWQRHNLRHWWNACYDIANAGLKRQSQRFGYADESVYLHPLKSDKFRDWRKTVEGWSTNYAVSWGAMREHWAS